MINLEIIDASLNYKYLMQEQYRQLYYIGQTQPISLLNVMAWGQFFGTLKNGDFKRKKESEPVWNY